jgi:hypothetical protein
MKTQKNDSWFVRISLALLLLSAAPAQSADSRALRRDTRDEILDCALNRGGEWVDKNLYSTGEATYTYTVRQQEKRTLVFIAFWGGGRTNGKLLEYQVPSNSGQRPEIALLNDAWLVQRNGKLDVKDMLGGIYEYEQLRSELPTLLEESGWRIKLVNLKHTSANCTSPLSK